jgi:cytochrome c
MSLRSALIATAPALAALNLALPCLAQEGGDPVRGATLFLQCRACHAVAQGAPNAVGPNLWGVMGSKAGMRPGFAYSASLSQTGITWEPRTLDRWLTQPTAVAPGTTMAFQGVASARSRADIIAYLATLDPKSPAKPPPR